MTKQSDSLGGTIALNCDERAAAPRCSSRTIYEGPLIRMNERARTAREPEDDAAQIQTSEDTIRFR